MQESPAAGVATKLPMGFAMAVLPVSAETIATDTSGLEAGEVSIPTGNPSEIVVYPAGGHAFHADYRPSYNQEAARDGWRRLQDWFKKYGVA
jgi:dienelactone hydrolase